MQSWPAGSQLGYHPAFGDAVLNRMIAVFLASILHAAIVLGQAAPAQPRVLLISCDGLRPDAIALADAPVLQHLIATGSYQATCLDEIPSVTLPNHASMVTGLGVARHGITANTTLPGRIAATTLFDAATAGGLRVGFFAGKGKLGYLCPEGSVNTWRPVSPRSAYGFGDRRSTRAGGPDG